jgi:hypothetical protein
MEIRVWKYPEATPPHWAVYAKPTNELNLDYKGFFGKAQSSSNAMQLAKFLISDSCGSRVSQCMRTIEEAIATGAPICDLSAHGDRAAWGDKWNLIDW